MTRTQFNVRLPEMSKKQVDEIAAATGLTITQILIMAIANLHKQILKTK